MNRYANTPRTWVPHPTQGWVQVTFREPMRWEEQVYSEYQTNSSDDMLLIASRNYGDTSLFWGIAEMNPTVLCPDDLEPGTIIRIPAGPR